MNVLIVDDEPLARAGMRMLLEEEPAITSIGEARNGAEAVETIRAQPPDLVLLDVQMPEMDGFGVLEELGAEHMPPVIFVTAHDRYAIQAFEVNAIDYLLKPVTRERFSAGAGAHARARELRRAWTTVTCCRCCSSCPRRRNISRAWPCVRPARSPSSTSKTCCTCRPRKTTCSCISRRRGTCCTCRSPRSSHRSIPQMFLRIHRSLIVNVRHIHELETGPHGEYIVVLKGGARLQSSRSFHEKIKRWAANPF